MPIARVRGVPRKAKWGSKRLRYLAEASPLRRANAAHSGLSQTHPLVTNDNKQAIYFFGRRHMR